MVFLRLNCHPGDEKATLGVSMTTSKPTLSLSALQASSSTPVLEIQIHIQCFSSVQPDQPLTFCTSGTIFNTAKPDYGHMDSLALGMFGPGLVCENLHNGKRKIISFGYFRVHRARQDNDNSTDLRERPDYTFITVPAKSSENKVTITYSLTSARLFAYAEDMTPRDLEVGEAYSARLSNGHIGPLWWCWGSLDGELKGKRLHSFSEGFSVTGVGERPSDQEIESGGWVTGKDVSELIFS
jgi:hypothetical protein